MKTKKRSRSKKNKKIKDPPFSKKINKGSDATEGLIDYHYQYYTNITDYIVDLCNKNKQINQKICLFNDPIDCSISLDQTNYKKGIIPKYISFTKFKNTLHSCDKRFVPVLLETIYKEENHANIIIIDNKKKRIELFEPHGNRDDESSLHKIKRSYSIKKEKVKLFFKKIYDDYQFVNVVDKLKKHTLQSKYDSNSGYCITWSLLYFHYRILNMSISYSNIVKYIDKKIKLNTLLRYAKHVEDTLKHI